MPQPVTLMQSQTSTWMQSQTSNWMQSQKRQRALFVSKANQVYVIQVIQLYAPTSNAEEAEVERFYEDLQDLLELTPKKDVLFIIGHWNAKIGSQEIHRVTENLALEYRMKQGKG